MASIDITAFLNAAGFRDYSASQAELGDNAGAITWAHAMENAPEYLPMLAPAMDDWRAEVAGMGAWDEAERAAWSDIQWTALFLQFTAGNIREAFPQARTADDISPADWVRYHADENIGGRLYRADDGTVFAYVGG